MVLLPLLVVASCGPFPQPPAETNLELPQSWRFADGQAVVNLDWWREFADPGLSAVVTEALAHNTDIGQAVERVEQARAAQRGARANRGPEIDFSNIGGYTRMSGTKTAFTTPELTISWDLDLFGRLKEADLAARATVLSNEASRDAVRLSVASTAASSYISLLGLDTQLAIVEENLRLRAEFLHTATRRAATGYTSALELRQAQSEYESNAALVPSTKLAIAQAEDALSILLGHSPRSVPRTPNGLTSIRLPLVPGALPSDLLTRRPDVYAAEQSLFSSDHSLQSARANRLPSFSITGFVGDSIVQVLPHAQLEYLIASSILGPIFDSGRRQATVDASRAQRDQAAYAYKAAILGALRDVNDALIAIQRDREQVELYERQVATQRSTLKLARDRYYAGYAPYFDQIDAERQLLSAQLSLAQARSSLLNAYTSLYSALGGGWYPGTPQPAQ